VRRLGRRDALAGALLERRLDEAGEERVRLEGLALELGWYWQPMKCGCPASSITSTSPSCSLTPEAIMPFSSSWAR